MKRQDQDQPRESKPEPGSSKREAPEERPAPPIEREHETSSGVFEEEDEGREHERQ